MKKALILVCGLLLLFVMDGCGGEKEAPAPQPVESEAAAPATTETAPAEKPAETAAAEAMLEGMAKVEGVDLDIDTSGDQVTVTGTDAEGKAIDIKATAEGTVVTTEDGGATIASGDQAKVPADFPKDVPLPPDATLEVSAADAAESGSTLIFSTTQTPDEVGAFYAKEAAAKGWNEEMNMKQAKMQMLSYSKEGRMLNVVVMSEAGKTQISVTLAKE